MTGASPRPQLRALGAAALVLAVVVSCSEADPSPPTGPLTKEEFIEEADGACGRSLDRREDVIHRLTDGRLPDPDAQERSFRLRRRYLNRLAPAFEDLVEYLRALRPPPDGRELLLRLIAVVQGQVDQVAEARRLAEREDPLVDHYLPGPLEHRDGFGRLRRALRAYGFTVCGVGPFDRP